MILLTLINFLITLSIFGYSYLLKFILLNNKNIKITNLDFFYGLIFLYLLSLFIHLFLPLGFFSELIVIIGILLSIYSIYKKVFKVNILKYFTVIFLFSIIAYYGIDNIDSPLYHLQIVKWLTDYKLTFGLANLGWRLGVNYPWYSLISLLNIEIFNFSNKYYFSIIFFSFLIYEIFDQKKINKSSIFLSISLSYLFLFSFIHPYNYGVILNHIGNPEKDLFNMLLFFSTVYIYLKVFENKNSNEFKNLIPILLIALTFLFMQVLIYSLLVLPFIYFFLKFIKLKENIKILTILFFTVLMWMFKSFAVNGCLIYPLVQTCIDTDWTINLSILDFHIDETKRYNRSLPGLEMINDTYKTLDTFIWFKSWFKNYFLTTALHQINLLIIISSSLAILWFVTLKKFFISKTDGLLLFSIVLVNLAYTLISPEIRYYWGPHISLSCIILSILIYFIDLNILKNLKIWILLPFISISLFLFTKVAHFVKPSDFINLPIRFHDYSMKKSIGNFDGYEIYTNNWQCADIKEICVNVPKKKYKFNYKNYFLIISN